MKAKHDPVIRIAVRIHNYLSQLPSSKSADWSNAVCEVLNHLRPLQANWRCQGEAVARGWNAAAGLKQAELMSHASRLSSTLTHLLYQQRPLLSPSSPVPLASLVAELRQLEQEFDDLTIDLRRGIVSTRIPRVVLHDVDLGPFSIELHLSRLTDRPSSDCFRCTALDPHPAAGHEDTVHPHLQDGQLCAGDAAAPIANALKEGRIADAFILIRCVLQTYNSHSPYVSLDDWTAQSCGECGDSIDRDRLNFCERCQNEICDDCYTRCENCGQGGCRSCLEIDPISGDFYCSSCLSDCRQCHRAVSELDLETELYPSCLLDQQATQQQENINDIATITTPPTAASAEPICQPA